MKRSSDGVCKFYEGKHVYKVKGEKYTSVTTLIGKHFSPFNQKEVARKLASFPINKKAKRGVRYWLREWKKNREEGTLSHEECELYIKDDKLGKILLPVFQPRSQLAIKWWEEWSANKIGYEPQPEMLIYDNEYKIAGQIDLPIINKEGEVILADWKFTKAIKQKGFNGAKGVTEITSHLDDCNYNKYALQLSMYAYMLERQGLTINGLVLVHVTEEGVVPYNVPYYRKEVIAILEDLKNDSRTN